jgi:hypothetical protein
MTDAINHPAHYTDGRLFEPDDIIADWSLSYRLGSVIAYIARAGRKPGSSRAEDLAKAAWFLARELEAERRGTDAPCDEPDKLPSRDDGDGYDVLAEVAGWCRATAEREDWAEAIEAWRLGVPRVDRVSWEAPRLSLYSTGLGLSAVLDIRDPDHAVLPGLRTHANEKIIAGALALWAETTHPGAA